MKNTDIKICPHKEFCGGCIYQGVPYEEQLAGKENLVLELIKKKGLKCESIDPIEKSPTQFKYRNKMEYTFGDLVKDGPITLGMHKKGNFMSIVTVDQCQLVPKEFNLILRATLDFVIEKGYPKYNKKSHKGVVRNLIIRKGMRTDEILINIVTASDNSPFNETPIIFDQEGFKDMILNLGKEENLNIVGVLRTINDNLGDAVNCQELVTIFGRDYYNEEVLGLKFKVSCFSFFQTNIDAVEKLYQEALALPTDFSNKVAYDLFCGTGTITQALAIKAKEVLGIEIIEEAIDAAKENCQINNLNNCHFIAGDVFKILDGKDADGQEMLKPDIIVVDPPRMGIEPKALDQIIKFEAPEIVYISCNPKTMVENLYYLEFYGYKIDYIKPFDNFPNTKHIECICLLSRTKK